MPAPLNVNREAVKTLAIAIGVRQAAREMGLPQGTVQAWSKRGHWFDDPRSKTAVIKGQQSVQPSATKAPSDALADILASHERETRLSLARYASNAAGAIHKSVHPTKWTKEAYDVAKTAGIVHRWTEQTSGNQFSLNVLNVESFNVQINE